MKAILLALALAALPLAAVPAFAADYPVNAQSVHPALIKSKCLMKMRMNNTAEHDRIANDSKVRISACVFKYLAASGPEIRVLVNGGLSRGAALAAVNRAANMSHLLSKGGDGKPKVLFF